MSPVRTFIITRPVADSGRFMEAVRAAGHAVLASPLLEIRFNEGAEIPARPWQAVAMTSANGARAIAAHPARESLIRAFAVTVGPASTKAAKVAGFTRVLQAKGDVKALISTVLERLSPQDGPILYASGAITRGDLQGELAVSGFDVARVVLYEAVQAMELSQPVRAHLAAGKGATVALYSPRSAKVWGRLAAEAGLADAACALTYACLSQNVARALREALPRACDILIPATPDEAALLRMLGLG